MSPSLACRAIRKTRWLLRIESGEFKLKNGGEEGIRTPDTLSGMPVFKTGAINHSATSPVTTD